MMPLESAPAPATVRRKMAKHGSPTRLLVVCDDEASRTLLRRRFTRIGYQVMEAGDSGKAMSITIWDSEAALMTSVSQADELRKRATQPSATTIESVQHYEIPMIVGTPARA